MFFAQSRHHTQNLIVCLALRQAQRQVVVKWLGLEQQVATRLRIACGAQSQALGNVSALRAGQCVQGAAGLACIASDLGHAFFMAVKLFEHDHGQEDVVFFKSEKAHRVMHQHIGVEHKQFFRPA